MFTSIQQLCNELVLDFDAIPNERKDLLTKISSYIQERKDKNQEINLVYVCTHNSRRSHFGQVWSAVAANYFRINTVNTFSGGTEATAFNPNAINALKEVGFEIDKLSETDNPHYAVKFGPTNKTICFSKTVDDQANPTANFAAIMTCSDADENCPFIPGVELRIGTTYEDPKAFDGMDLQDIKYQERSKQIAKECLFVFSQIK
jgi:protein-tyrosine phosphatase/arsenate reductase